MEYRKAHAGDIDEMVRLRVEFLNEANGVPTPPPGFEHGLRSYLGKALADGSFVAWLAEADGRVAATSSVCFHEIAPNYSNPGGRSAYVLNMYTVPAYRRRGLASELFARLIEEARGRGCGKITLHTTEDGRKVYERFGFRGTDDEMAFKLQ